MLIVEGSDLVGKSALCNELIRRLWLLNYPIIYQHFGILPESWDYFEDYISFMNKRVCMDRFIMSEVVYGEICRNGSKINPMRYYELDGWLRVNQSVTIVITAEYDWLHQQYERVNRKEYYNEELILKANQGFYSVTQRDSEFLCDFDFNYHIINTMPSSDNKFINQVIKRFLERTRNETLFRKTEHLHQDG